MPTNEGVNGFQPRHAQNEGVYTDWSDIEYLSLMNAGDGELQGNFAIVRIVIRFSYCSLFWKLYCSPDGDKLAEFGYNLHIHRLFFTFMCQFSSTINSSFFVRSSLGLIVNIRLDLIPLLFNCLLGFRPHEPAGVSVPITCYRRLGLSRRASISPDNLSRRVIYLSQSYDILLYSAVPDYFIFSDAFTSYRGCTPDTVRIVLHI